MTTDRQLNMLLCVASRWYHGGGRAERDTGYKSNHLVEPLTPMPNRPTKTIWRRVSGHVEWRKRVKALLLLLPLSSFSLLLNPPLLVLIQRRLSFRND